MPWAPPPAGSCATSATASSSAPATPTPSPRALRTLHDDPELRARLGANAAHDVAPYTHAAWADGFAAALRGATGQEMPC